MPSDHFHKLRLGMVKPWRKESYLAWVRMQPCICCNAQPAGHAHHITSFKGMGTKAPDYMTMPLCPMHHSELHDAPIRWEALHGRQELHVFETLCRAIDAGILTARGAND